MTLQTKFHVPRPNIEDFQILPRAPEGVEPQGVYKSGPRRKFEKMKKMYGGNHLTKLCTKFGVNPKKLSGSKIGGTVWDGQTDRGTDGQSEYNIHSASRVYKNIYIIQLVSPPYTHISAISQCIYSPDIRGRSSQYVVPPQRLALLQSQCGTKI